jgi:hypothetical protein
MRRRCYRALVPSLVEVACAVKTRDRCVAIGQVLTMSILSACRAPNPIEMAQGPAKTRLRIRGFIWAAAALIATGGTAPGRWNREKMSARRSRSLVRTWIATGASTIRQGAFGTATRLKGAIAYAVSHFATACRRMDAISMRRSARGIDFSPRWPRQDPGVPARCSRNAIPSCPNDLLARHAPRRARSEAVPAHPRPTSSTSRTISASSSAE